MIKGGGEGEGARGGGKRLLSLYIYIENYKIFL